MASQLSSALENRAVRSSLLVQRGCSPANDARGYLLPFLTARDAVAQRRKENEREARKLAVLLPVWKWAEGVSGFGSLGLAQIVGEAGDLSAYSDKSKLWKRMGLAVIDGQRQRRVKGADALRHGYSPERRAIMFCIGDSLIKKQGPYREIYLQRKEYEQAKLPEPEGFKMVWHRRAQRYMEKWLLRDLWREWGK